MFISYFQVTLMLYTPITMSITVTESSKNLDAAPILATGTTAKVLVLGSTIGTRNIPVRIWPRWNWYEEKTWNTDEEYSQ